MSTGISIQQAQYGINNSQVDVTGTIAGMIKDGSLTVQVSASALNVTDPAPGQLKLLVIKYTINGGKTNTASEKDGGVISINAPPQRVASGLQITKAEYGVRGNYQDVTDAVQNLVSSDGSIDMKVGFKEVGLPDPDPSKVKIFIAEYTINGATNMVELKDGERFRLNAPATDAPDNSTPSQHVGSFMSIIFKNVATFFGVFAHALSIFIAMEYGNQFFIKYFWMALAFFIPFFSFWALPIITFWVRLFSSEDIIKPLTAAIPI
jgi:hypothetical protein